MKSEAFCIRALWGAAREVIDYRKVQPLADIHVKVDHNLFYPLHQLLLKPLCDEIKDGAREHKDEQRT